MSRLAFFFHTRLSGGDFPEHPDAKIPSWWGHYLFRQQTESLSQSGLMDNANKIVVGVNGSPSDFRCVESGFSEGVEVVEHGAMARSLIPTMRLMQKFCKDNPGWFVLFFHAKGATHPNDPFTTAWRNCMTRHCVTNWRQCVADLETGLYDSVGAHWRHNSPNDPNADRMGGNSYWGGVFYWVTSDYFATLPMLPEKATDRHSFYLPELLIGCNNPRVKDYHPEGPLSGCH